VETKTLSLTDEIYSELVDGFKLGLDWTAFIAKHGASKGPLYNALGRFFNDLEPKVRELGAVQTKLDDAGLALDSLNQNIKEAESSLAPLEDRKSTLNEQIETLETKLAEKSEFMKHVGELGKFGFDTERLRRLQDTLREIGAKTGLKGKEAVSKFFDELKDYEAKTGFEQEIHRFETIIRTKTLEAEKWQAEADSLSRQHKDLTEAIAAVQDLDRQGVKAEQVVYWNGIVSKIGSPEALQDKLERYYGILKAAGFDEKALGEITKAAEKYGTPRKVFMAVNRFGDLSKIKAINDELRNKIKQKRALVKDLDEKYSHMKESIELCNRLIKRKFGLLALQLINITARRYGKPTEVMKAIEAYGALKEIKKETDQAKIELAEIEGKIKVANETYAECNAKNAAILDQFEALNAKAIEVGQQVGSIQEQVKKDSLAREILTLLQNPALAGHEEYSPLVLVLLNSISIWANINRSKFRFSSLIDKNLQEVIGYLGGS